MSQHERNIAIAIVSVAALGTLAFGEKAEALDRMRVYYREGNSVSLQVIPDGRRALQVRSLGGDRYELAEDPRPLIGKSYVLRIENHGRQRIKVVIAVDGVNVFFRKPVEGYARADVGAVLEGREVRTIKGFQVDRDEGQRFVFSPPEFSEGKRQGRVGEIELHVYEEWRPEREGVALGEELAGRVEAAKPGMGTTTGDDFASEVRRVRFVSATSEPVARLLFVYGREDEEPIEPIRPRRTRLGVTIEGHPSGCLITDVEPHSLAEEVGLRRGDVIVQADSEEEPSPRELREIIAKKRSGDYLFLEVERHHHTLTFKIRM